MTTIYPYLLVESGSSLQPPSSLSSDRSGRSCWMTDPAAQIRVEPNGLKGKSCNRCFSSLSGFLMAFTCSSCFSWDCCWDCHVKRKHSHDATNGLIVGTLRRLRFASLLCLTNIPIQSSSPIIPAKRCIQTGACYCISS